MTAETGAGAAVWYADGLRFECTMCGNCCTGPAGAVWFDREEGRAMAERLGVDEKTFYKRYARREGERWSLRETPTKFGLDCVLLDRDTVPGKAVCGVYETRPHQCRTWPFWPENLRSEHAWREVKRVTPCPGMDNGRLIPVEEVRVTAGGGSP